MSNAYVDPWDMPINFYFHVYAQKGLFIGEHSNAFFWTAAAPFDRIGQRLRASDLLLWKRGKVKKTPELMK